MIAYRELRFINITYWLALSPQQLLVQPATHIFKLCTFSRLLNIKLCFK